MGKVSVQIEGFSGPYAGLNGTRELRVSRRAILAASITLGFQSFGDLRSAPGRHWFHRFLTGCQTLNCLSHTRNGWRENTFRDSLDASEKNPLSYWQGMIFAKLVAAEFLSVPWLANVDDLKSQGLIQTAVNSKKRGDLVGQCKDSRWHVIEAKGRSNPYPSKLISDAKEQAGQVISVSGAKPATHAACVASLWEDPIKVILADPPPNGDEHLDFDEDFFWKSYYAGLGSFINEFRVVSEYTKPFEGYTFASLKPLFADFSEEEISGFVPLPEVIGLPDAILERPASARSVIAGLRERGLPVEGDGLLLVGPFGSLEKMRRKG